MITKENIELLYNKDNKIACSMLYELEEESKLFNNVYKYINEFFNMLDNNQSYVRNRALSLISKNAKWDEENIINKNIEKYLIHITDEKPITARTCIKGLKDIIKYKKDLCYIIKDKLLNVHINKYKDSMKPLIKKDIDEILKEMK